MTMKNETKQIKILMDNMTVKLYLRPYKARKMKSWHMVNIDFVGVFIQSK